MNCMLVEKAIISINNYLKSSVSTPFFVIVDDNSEYADVLKTFSSLLSTKYTSDFCVGDAYPNYNNLYNYLTNITTDTLLLGLGESILMGGSSSILGKIKDIYGNYKIVVICRGVRKEILRLSYTDAKFNDRRMCFVESKGIFDVIKYNKKLEINVMADNFQKLLSILEEGENNRVTCKTSLFLKSAKFIDTPYEAIKYNNPAFNISEKILSENLWSEYLLDNNCEGYNIDHWRTYLNFLIIPSENNYIEFVMKKSMNYEEYKYNLFTALLSVSYKEKDFWVLYHDRKKLLKDISSGDIADYVSKTTVHGNGRIYYLTDNTVEEKHTILMEITKIPKIPKEIEVIYPAICDYLNNYRFTCKNKDKFNLYFEKYKLMKLKNIVESDFLENVSALAKPGNRAYNMLETRGAIIEKFDSQKDNLYWIDALGVEYLGYIQKKANALELNINIQIARAELPTLTSLNKDFYVNWQGKKEQTKELDNIKHNKGKYPYKGNLPIYISEELEILDEKLDWIKSELGSKRATKIILTSDHGASRLSVINKKENKWDMKTKGLHSGRCCSVNEVDEQPEFATEENGFWVFANYDRFKGGRKSDVEVHGGASLEEVLVPVIEISLKDAFIDIENLTPETEADKFKTAPRITLFSSFDLNDVSVYFNGKYYMAIQDKTNTHKHHVEFSDYREPGMYKADVYAGDNIIGQIEFTINNKIGREKDYDFFN